MEQFQPHSSPIQRSYSEANFDGSRPAPLKLIGEDADKALVARQDALIVMMQKASHDELRGVVTDDVADFVAQGVTSRMHMREGLNSMSYRNRLHQHPHPWLVKSASWKETIEACRVTVAGAQSVRQSDMAQRALGMASIEYKNLTMFGEFRRELEAPMWDEMSEFLGVDATPHGDQVYRMKLLGFKGDLLKNREIGAMRIELKRHIECGVLDNGTVVKSRSTATINTSFRSAFDQTVMDSLREMHHEAIKSDKKVDLSTNPEFIKYVGYLVDNSLPAGLVLARNETSYGGNAQLADEIRRRDEARRRMKAVLTGKKHFSA